ncbi:NUDIX domain-containing protein [Gordonia sp. CPCC 205515]|uniref:NUDIX hydrolase n=1 Tax=Gordonia sp. CPCC 205515 TaxID=3140791 RepID=UPI003AF3E863
MSEEREIVVSGVVVRNRAGDLLTVRKRGTERFMLPGGKPEPGESAIETAVRECAEEVGLRVDANGLRHLGTYRTAAANEPGHALVASVFALGEPVEAVSAAAEIAEVRWLDLSAPLPGDLAPLLIECVIGDL